MRCPTVWTPTVLHRILDFSVTFHTPWVAGGEASRKSLHFASTRPLETCFMGKKKERIEENNISVFNTLKSLKKHFEEWLSEIKFKIECFCHLPDLKKCLE